MTVCLDGVSIFSAPTTGVATSSVGKQRGVAVEVASDMCPCGMYGDADGVLGRAQEPLLCMKWYVRLMGTSESLTVEKIACASML